MAYLDARPKAGPYALNVEWYHAQQVWRADPLDIFWNELPLRYRRHQPLGTQFLSKFLNYR
jgi:hypothetical protein